MATAKKIQQVGPQVEKSSSKPKDAPNLKEQLRAGPIGQFPYQSRLSFHKLIEHWRQELASKNAADALIATKIFMELEKVPELTQPIEDYSILEKNQGLVDLLLSGLFPSALKESQLVMASSPFSLNHIYRTPSLDKLFHSNQHELKFEDEVEGVIKLNVIKSGMSILKEVYGYDYVAEMPMMMILQDKETKQERIFKANPNMSFCEVRPLKPVKPIDEATVKQLINNIHDTDLWLKHLPVDDFEFLGMITVQLIDVTVEESYSRLKLATMERNSVADPKQIANLERYLQTFFGIADLKLAIMGKQYQWVGNFDNKMLKWSSLIPFKEAYMNDDYSKSCYGRAFLDHNVSLAEDLAEYPTPSKYEEDLIKAGYRSGLIAPLMNDDGDMVGVVQLGSKTPYAFNSLSKEKFKHMLPMFTVAVQRQLEDYRNEIDVLIKSNFTSIHPSVEWSFVEAAIKLKTNPESNEIDPIIYNDVYPLYGQADIVGSSKTRNLAIREDLKENLELARKMLASKSKIRAYPLLGELRYRINNYIKQLDDHLNSGDEVEITEFIITEVQPALNNLADLDPAFAEDLKTYYAQLDEEKNVIYARRQAYEDSLADINEMLASFVDAKQEKAQAIFPHYFERYNTDGIEYNMYIGQSIAKTRKFDNMFLENLKLWQLILMAEITQKVKNLQSSMKVPLDTAQLILVFSDPIAIRFKMDEKQFDVDGAYNIRYEVIKKRIDKARILGTNERMTVAGKIAIVYTHEEDKREYLRYIEYMQSKGLIGDEVEDLDIEPLQGVQGLKALRVTVNPNPDI